MTPFIGEGEAQLSVPTLTAAMFSDFGWGLEARTASETLVTAASRDFIKRFPTPDELRALARALDDGTWTQHDLVRAYALSDEWIGAIVDGYYLSTLGRSADPAGKAHWSDMLRSGTSSADVVSAFYASTEYYRRAGGTNRSWVQSLYRQILGREPDAAGLDGWADAADRGAPLTQIARGLFQAPETRAKRVTGLYRSLLGRRPEPEGLAYWTDVLRNGRDVDLAIVLASSPEYRDRSVHRFG